MEATWGTLTEDDVPRLAALLTAIEAADELGETHTEADVRERLRNPLLDLADGTLAARVGDRIVAYGYLPVKQNATDTHPMVVGGGVHPEFRRQGYGTRILEWAVEQAPKLHERRFPGVGGLELHVGADDRTHDRAALAMSLGFVKSRSFLDMEADLSGPLPQVNVPEGIEIVPWSPELDAGARAVRNESFSDHWGSVPHTGESWRHYVTGRHFLPQGSFLALAGRDRAGDGQDRAGDGQDRAGDGQDRAGDGRGPARDGRDRASVGPDPVPDGQGVVGIVMAQEHTAPNGSPYVWIAIVGTLAGWRGRGVAGALLGHALRFYRQQGYATVELGVDADNGTGAVRVYEKAGFHATNRGSVYVRKII
ncbi:GNAT family N-acetyltransferase [Nonomuraea sp. NPDC050663]|uniref:GNAT family N-acetyltransferase n=1 Tax=Nonomuraea sp. NPDC050663 TaxID=3364370 RepID=UPI0037A46C38